MTLLIQISEMLELTDLFHAQGSPLQLEMSYSLFLLVPLCQCLPALSTEEAK